MDQESTASVDDGVRRLVRAVGRGSNRDSDIAYRHLFAMGRAVIPSLQAVLYATDFSKLSTPIMLRLTTLLMLIHDLDEDQSRETAARILRGRCDPLYELRIKTVLAYARENFLEYKIRDISIYESRFLRRHSKRRRLLTKWLGSLPASDLAGIEKIYLIPPASQEFRGTYAPYLGVVTLVWDELLGTGHPLTLLNHMMIEKTLYHEVGHHVYRHTYGQIPEQEKQADAYAFRRLRVAHPRARKVGQAVRRVLIPLGWGNRVGRRFRAIRDARRAAHRTSHRIRPEK